MNNSKSLLEEAEKNVVMQAKFFHELLTFVDSFTSATSRKMVSQTNKEAFADGMIKARVAIYTEMQFAFARCFAFVGVGGDEANKLSKEYAKELFDGKYSNIQWLDKWYSIPNGWRSSDEAQFTKEIQEAIKKNERN